MIEGKDLRLSLGSYSLYRLGRTCARRQMSTEEEISSQGDQYDRCSIDENDKACLEGASKRIGDITSQGHYAERHGESLQA